MMIDVSHAQKYVEEIDLSGTPRAILSMSAATEAGAVFEQAKTQAQVVGSALFSFAQGVDVNVREAISDSALLAQLVANKQASSSEAPLKWFAEYSTVLQNVGWTLQDHAWTDYKVDGVGVEVHEQIIKVITATLTPTPAAIAIVTATVDALKGMTPGSSWFTIFKRESTKAKIARFQIGLVEKEANGGVFVSLLACLIEAEDAITQVLFFKLRNSNASFKALADKVSINRDALINIGPAIRTKIRAYQSDYLSSIQNI